MELAFAALLGFMIGLVLDQAAWRLNGGAWQVGEETLRITNLVRQHHVWLVLGSDDVARIPQTTQLVQKKEKDTSDGPAIMWAAVRRWMEQIDPGYMH